MKRGQVVTRFDFSCVKFGVKLCSVHVEVVSGLGEAVGCATERPTEFVDIFKPAPRAESFVRHRSDKISDIISWCIRIVALLNTPRLNTCVLKNFVRSLYIIIFHFKFKKKSHFLLENCYADASFAVHPDFKSHGSVLISCGQTSHSK